jgi:uncharacterized protein with HEPN domain
MQKSDNIRLRHMFDAAKEAASFIQEEERASLDVDRKLVLALMKSIEIIGEAATKITKECQEDLSQIPWPNIIGMRNRLIHAYFDVNLEILWKTVTEDLPGLIDELEKILPSAKV